MDRKEALNLLRGGPEGIAEWNRWRQRGDPIPDLIKADLAWADLSGVNLSEAKLGEANLSGATLTGANLSKADLSWADLSGADLSGSNLSEADLRETILVGCKLKQANLVESRLVRTNFRDADLSGANLTLASMVQCDLTDALLDDAIIVDIQVRDASRIPRIATGGTVRGGHSPTLPESASEPELTSSPISSPVDSGGRDRTVEYRVWFGTNRKPAPGLGLSFTSHRNKVVHYGTCDVAIPKYHTIGSIGSPWWRRWLTGRDDRLKLTSITSKAEQFFWSDLRAELAQWGPTERTALVYIHGYNVSFTEAAIRAAQIGFDLQVPGVTAFFSWPSKGRTTGYVADEATIAAAEPFITEFLENFVAEAGAERVHILAHSMGNRALLGAMQRLLASVKKELRPRFGQIFLAAPDVDCDTFRDLAVAYKELSDRTTLYVSRADRALASSGILHDFPRAGFLPPVTVVSGIDTVEATNIDVTLLGHSYYANARDMLHDMYTLIRHNDPPADRLGLIPATNEEGLTYWRIRA